MTKRMNLAQAKALIPLLRSIANEVRERSLRVKRHEALRTNFATTPSPEGFITAIDDLDTAIRIESRAIEGALSELGRLGLEIQSTAPFVVHIPGRTPGGDVVFSWEAGSASATFQEAPQASSETPSEIA